MSRINQALRLALLFLFVAAVGSGVQAAHAPVSTVMAGTVQSVTLDPWRNVPDLWRTTPQRLEVMSMSGGPILDWLLSGHKPSSDGGTKISRASCSYLQTDCRRTYLAV